MADKNGRYGATFGSHRVELEFDKSWVVVNQVRLFLDGELVDSSRVVYGDRTLGVDTPDGPVEIQIHSGMVGELTRAQLKQTDGSWIDLAPAGQA